MSLRALLLAYISSRVTAVPLHPRAAEDVWFDSLPNTVAWTGAPQVRGTFDLLLSCITTLSLCAWTAYHPNVYYTSSSWRRLGHRALWMSVAIFLPELVLYCAWEQWWTTSRLRNELDDIGPAAFDGHGICTISEDCSKCTMTRQSSDSSEYNLDLLFGAQEIVPPTGSPGKGEQERTLKDRFHYGIFRLLPRRSGKKADSVWTKEQAFFAVTGGYAVPLSIMDEQSKSHSPAKRPTHVTLTPAGIVFLAKLGLLPNVTPATVSDKSKADLVAKLLVCIQTGWFLLQCIARTAEGLPLSLLEVHVLTHVLCAFAMYLLWINKPYDVGSPIMIDHERVRELAALWVLGKDSSSRLGHGDSFECAFSSQIRLSHVQSFHANHNYCTTSRQTYVRRIRRQLEMDKPATLRQKPSSDPTSSSEIERLHLEQANAALAFLKSCNIHFPYQSKAIEIPYRSLDPNDASPQYVLKEHVNLRFSSQYIVPERSNLIVDGISGLASADASRFDHIVRALKTYAFMGTAYGGLHLIAWNAHFASISEAWLWRASGIVMMAAPISGAIFASSFVISDVATRRWRRCKTSVHMRQGRKTMERVRYRVVDTMGMGIMFLSLVVAAFAWMAYPFARGFVLVESFVSLRAVEKGVYKTVEWTGFIPHAG